MISTQTKDAVTLCIISYNGLEYLISLFDELANANFDFDEILVVDNNSNDGSKEFLQSLKDVNVLALATNTGPAGARNAGFAAARHDLILFQDNDISLRANTPALLISALVENPRALVTAPRVIYRSKSNIIQYESADCHLLGLMSLRNANAALERTNTHSKKTTSLVAACFAIDRSRWRHGKLFDESFIFNLEDHDLGVRANLIGYDTLVIPAASVLHGCGTKGLSYRPGQEVSATRMYCLIRNRWWLIIKCYSTRTLFVLAPILILYELFQLSGLLAKGWGKQWLKALRDTLLNLGNLLRKRRYLQSERKKTDGQILKGGHLPLTIAMISNPFFRFIVKAFDSVVAAYWCFAKKLLKKQS